MTDVAEDIQPQPIEPPTVATPAPEPEPVPQATAEPAQSEPVANQSLIAPGQKPARRHATKDHATTTEPASPIEPSKEEVPSSPPSQPIAATPADSGRNLSGKRFYTVQPGDCLWHIAAALLPPNAGTLEIEEKIERLWHLNEQRIGTEDPNLIYPGAVLKLGN